MSRHHAVRIHPAQGQASMQLALQRIRQGADFK